MSRRHLNLEGWLEIVAQVSVLGTQLGPMVFGSKGMDTWGTKGS